jgi:GalNAc-alpha-(1->4)-GalNAc-alpha-(1->3)-diNAcBac-PP-undecaprenol alpha-1,4-N-acetyl-D-galactosaminyltransferase
MRLLILIPALQMGGAERMACFLAGEWARAGHQVDILTLDGPKQPYFEVDARVGLHHLKKRAPSRNFREMLSNFLVRIRDIRRHVVDQDSDVVIGFGGSSLALASLAVIGLRARSIAYEQTDPLFTERDMGRLKRVIHRLALRFAEVIVVQTEAAREVLHPALQRRARVIPNPVRPLKARAAPAIPGPDGHYRVAALGRLNPVKGFDVLLQAWARVQSELPSWILVIHGEGEERPHLERIIAETGLQGRVLLPGATNQADQCLSQANLFVMSSRTEGFPNSLCEAMAVGLPVISTDCRFGPSEIVTAGRDGLLVPVDDPRALGDAILDLATDPQRLAAMGDTARVVSERFSVPVVMAMWERLIAEIT